MTELTSTVKVSQYLLDHTEWKDILARKLSNQFAEAIYKKYFVNDESAGYVTIQDKDDMDWITVQARLHVFGDEELEEFKSQIRERLIDEIIEKLNCTSELEGY